MGSSGGCSTNPTVQSFRYALQHIITSNLEKPSESSNCELLEEEEHHIEELDTTSNKRPPPPLTGRTEEEGMQEHDVNEENEQVMVTSKSPSLETCAVRYVAGYVCRKTIKKFNCENCKNYLVRTEKIDNPHDLLILKRDYGCGDVQFLYRPTETVYRVADLVLDTFEDLFENHKHEKSIVTYLNTQCDAKLRRAFPDFFNQCQEHRTFYVNFLIKTKMFKVIKWLSEEKVKPIKSKSGKLNKLKHL